MTDSIFSADAEADRLIQHLQLRGRFDMHSPTALYRRLQDGLRSAIREGVVAPGAMIPGERELAQRLDLSRVTVRKALRGLVEERLMVQRQGARTSVAERLAKPIFLFTSFSQDMEERGMRPGGVWLKREVRRASAAEALLLGLSPGAEVCDLQRLRTADDVPMALEVSLVPAEFLPDPGIVGSSLYATLDGLGCLPTRALQRLRSDVATREEARQLGVAAGAPLLEIERRCTLDNGRVVEACRSRYRGDAYDFLIELVRRPAG